MNKDILLDIHRPASKSDINLESPNCAGDIALDGHVLERLYDDFVFADYIDMDNGFIKHESGLVTIDSAAAKTWRKARVIMIGPSCRETSVGDIILFPNDKGLPCGKIDYSENDRVLTANNGIFLSEHRIFATLRG